MLFILYNGGGEHSAVPAKALMGPLLKSDLHATAKKLGRIGAAYALGLAMFQFGAAVWATLGAADASSCGERRFLP